LCVLLILICHLSAFEPVKNLHQMFSVYSCTTASVKSMSRSGPSRHCTTRHDMTQHDTTRHPSQSVYFRNSSLWNSQDVVFRTFFVLEMSPSMEYFVSIPCLESSCTSSYGGT